MPTEPTGSPESRSDDRELTLAAKIGLSALVVRDFLRVAIGLRRTPLPDLVRRLRQPPGIAMRPLDPRRLGRIVHRVLRIGAHRPRCIVTSLVLFRMLRRQETDAEVVIGLPPAPESHHAHAWVEVDGREVGPPPGRLGHEEMARYGRPATG